MAASRYEPEFAVYERIVVPLDGSDLAERTLPHAMTLARSSGAPIHLLRVVDITPLTGLSAVGLGVEQTAVLVAIKGIEAEAAAAEEYLEAIRQRIDERGLEATAEVTTGLVVSSLLDAINPRDIVAMTTHGRTGLARWFYGSVAEGVLQRSPAPVLLVRSVALPTQVAETSEGAA